MSSYCATPLTTVEVFPSEAKPGFSLRKGDVELEKLDDWLSTVASNARHGGTAIAQAPVLQAICCNFGTRSLASGQDIQILERIVNGLDLHWTTMEAFMTNNGTYARHLARDTNSKISKTYIILRVPHFVIGSFCLSLVHYPNTQRTVALLHGYTRSDLTSLSRYLSSSDSLDPFRSSLLLPAQLLHLFRLNAESYRAKIDACIFATEVSLGYAVPGSFAFVTIEQARNHGTFSGKGRMDVERFAARLHECHDEVMRKLHTCQTELCALIYMGNFGSKLGDFLKKTEEEVVTTGVLVERAGHEMIMDMIEFQVNLFQCMVQQMAVLKERTQSHINLIFSLIAQDENRLSRTVAQKSELLAAASKKDSAAMRTLAVLTTVFLPPTFVATFFSMDMFDWTAASPSSLVSSRLQWVYWAVALPLTALVLLSWRVWWGLEEKREKLTKK